MKPTYQEWIAITAMVFGSVGLVLGTLSSSSNEKLMNIHSIRNRVDRVTQPTDED